MSQLRLTTSDQTATVWLEHDRLNFERLLELQRLVESVRRDPGVRVLVLRGRPGHFIAGHDLAELESLRTESDWLSLARRTQAVCLALVRLALHTHTVAFLDGPCLGDRVV